MGGVPCPPPPTANAGDEPAWPRAPGRRRGGRGADPKSCSILALGGNPAPGGGTGGAWADTEGMQHLGGGSGRPCSNPRSSQAPEGAPGAIWDPQGSPWVLPLRCWRRRPVGTEVTSTVRAMGRGHPRGLAAPGPPQRPRVHRGPPSPCAATSCCRRGGPAGKESVPAEPSAPWWRPSRRAGRRQRAMATAAPLERGAQRPGPPRAVQSDTGKPGLKQSQPK